MTLLREERIALPTGSASTSSWAARASRSCSSTAFPNRTAPGATRWPISRADHLVVAPDQRGFGGSDKPDGVEHYATDKAVADLIALADWLGLGAFTLVGHDWGGAVAWLAALRHPDRVKRLVIVNAPHPLVFQKSLIDDPDQRAASQYMNRFRDPRMEAGIAAMGLDAFFEKSFAGHVDLAAVPPDERRAYVHDWGQPGALSAMLNWYRASAIVVPAPGEEPRRRPGRPRPSRA